MEYLIEESELEGDPEYMVMMMPVSSPTDYYPDEGIIYVPERIMWRILGIGNAYNLQFVEHVSPNFFDRWVYRGETLSWVREELIFIVKLVNDPVLVEYVNEIISIFVKAISQPNKLQIALEGP